MPLLHFAYYLMHCQPVYITPLIKDNRHNEFVKFLISGGYCDINQQTSKGYTLLHMVCMRSDKEMLSLLLNIDNCDLNCASSDGSTPLHLARA